MSSYLSRLFSLSFQLSFVRLFLHFCVVVFFFREYPSESSVYLLCSGHWTVCGFYNIFLLLPLWMLYVWITAFDPELHATNPAETWGQQAHDALIANENYGKNREGKRKCSSPHCSVSVLVNFHRVRNII